MSTFSLFFGTCIFALQYLSFGVYLTRFLKIKLTHLEKILIGVYTALAINSAIFFLIGHVIGSRVYFFSLIPLIIGFIKLKYLKSTLTQIFKQALHYKFLSALAFTAIIGLAGTLAFSWISTESGLSFQSGQLHDSVWHIALINKLESNIPPEHPSNFTLLVTNYHYFYDLIIAGMSKVFYLDATTLYFQVFPFILTTLLAGSAAALGKRLKNVFTSGYLLFLTFFAGSFAYLIPLFLPKNTWHDSSFWVTQTFGMMVNPQNILTFGLTYVVLLLMLLDLKNNKESSLIIQVILILLISTSLGFKSYSFMVLSILYGFYLLMKIIDLKSLLPVVFGLVFTAVSLPFIWLITGFKSSAFIFEPLWFVDTMVESPDRLNHLKWTFMEDHYRLKNNWLRVWELKIKQLLIFYGGNLGIRILSLGIVPLLLYKKLKAQKIYLLVLAGFLFSSIFPLLFIQRGVVWNTIQFWYYSLIFANIFTALVLGWIHQQLIGFGLYKKIALISFLLMVVSLSLPTVVSIARIKYLELETITAAELELLKKIQPQDKIIVHPGQTRYFQTSLVSAITQAQMLHADPVQLILMDYPVDEVEDELIDMIENRTNELANQYPKAKLILHKQIESDSLTLIKQANDKYFLYQL